MEVKQKCWTVGQWFNCKTTKNVCFDSNSTNGR